MASIGPRAFLAGQRRCCQSLLFRGPLGRTSAGCHSRAPAVWRHDRSHRFFPDQRLQHRGQFGAQFNELLPPPLYTARSRLLCLPGVFGLSIARRSTRDIAHVSRHCLPAAIVAPLVFRDRRPHGHADASHAHLGYIRGRLEPDVRNLLLRIRRASGRSQDGNPPVDRRSVSHLLCPDGAGSLPDPAGGGIDRLSVVDMAHRFSLSPPQEQRRRRHPARGRSLFEYCNQSSHAGAPRAFLHLRHSPGLVVRTADFAVKTDCGAVSQTRRHLLPALSVSCHHLFLAVPLVSALVSGAFSLLLSDCSFGCGAHSDVYRAPRSEAVQRGVMTGMMPPVPMGFRTFHPRRFQ